MNWVEWAPWPIIYIATAAFLASHVDTKILKTLIDAAASSILYFAALWFFAVPIVELIFYILAPLSSPAAAFLKIATVFPTAAAVVAYVSNLTTKRGYFKSLLIHLAAGVVATVWNLALGLPPKPFGD